MPRPRKLDTEIPDAAPSLVEAEVHVPRGEAASLAVGVGLLTALAVGGGLVTTELQWWAIPLRASWIGALAGCGVYIALMGAHTWAERRERRGQTARTPPSDWHAEAESEPRQWMATAVVKSPDGRHQLWRRYALHDPLAWHRFCKAVEGGRNFSWNESQRHEVPQHDWETVVEDFEAAGWYKLAKRRGTPDLRGPGKAMVKAWATTPPARE